MNKLTIELIMGIKKNPNPSIIPSNNEMMVAEGLRAPVVNKDNNWMLKNSPYEKRLIKEAKSAHKKAGSPKLFKKSLKIS